MRRGPGDPQSVGQRTHAERLAARDGWFAPESLVRRLGNTPVTPFLGGGAAVLLQVSHPLVAAGVVAHSDYRHDLWRRLARTLRALYLITYGTKEEAEQAGAVVQAVHAHVRGRTREPLGRYPAGMRYSANDPELMLWVHATLVHASLEAYGRFVHRLTPEDEEQYYAEMSLVARIFGTPCDAIPPTLADFRAYFDAMVGGNDLCVTASARDVAEVILDAPLPAPLRLLAPSHRLATAAILPRRVRDEYHLRWTPLHALALPVAGRSMHLGAMPLLRVAARIAPPPALAA
jgi:uncharacterized protein (DUF2236 family)